MRSLAFLGLALLAPSAMAQTGAEPAPPNPELNTLPVALATTPEAPATEQEKAVKLEEIVVTATKRETTARSIAGSVTALRGKDLEKSGAQGIADIIKQVPGVTFSDNGTEPERVTIRGIAADNNGNSTTGILFGDIPFTDPYTPRVTLDPNPFDLATVEVLKGPQGTLFGGSALNGAVRYVPQGPVLGKWQARYYAQYSDVSQGDTGWNYGGALNVPVGDTAALRATAFYRKAPGWVDDENPSFMGKDVNRMDQDGVRGQLRWEPGDNTVELIVAKQDSEAYGFPFVDNQDGRLSRDTVNSENRKITSYTLASLTLGHRFESFEIKSITGSLTKDAEIETDSSRQLVSPAIPVRIALTSDSEAVLQEIRLSSFPGEGNWDWFIGAFGQRSKVVEDGGLLAGPRLPLPLSDLLQLIPGLIVDDYGVYLGKQDAHISLRELAVFGELTWRPLTDVEVTLGARQYWNKSSGYVHSEGAIYASNGQLESTLPGELKENGLSPKASLKWRINDHVTSYAAVSRGFRFGGQQRVASSATTQIPPYFKSDTLWNYEGGVRTDWFNRKLQFDATGFLADWKYAQLQALTPDALVTYIDNVGGVRSYGAELASTLRPVQGLSLRLGGAYVNAKTTKPYTTPSGNEVPTGTDWPLASRYQGSAIAAYARPVGPTRPGASLAYSYLSSARSRIDSDQRIYDFGQFDFQFDLGFANRSIPTISLIVNNLTDERGIAGYFQTVTAMAEDVVYIRPRTISLRISGEF